MAKRLLNTQRIVNLSADPASGTAGEIYYNTTSNTFKYYDGTAWVSLAGSGGLPSQSGNSGKYLTTNGTDPSWASVEALPSQTGNSGKYLTTNGTTASWSAVDADLLDGQHGSYYLDWTNATNKPDPTITLGGDLSGSITLTDLAGGTLTATINADSVALGTDTTGNYVASVSGTDGVSISGTGEGASVTIANSDKGSSQNIFKNIAVSGQSDIVADSNNDTVTFAGGTGITLTTNDTTDTLTVTNSGVTSLSGTANQITASASTGSVTLSIPSSVVFPGTVTLNADPGQALEAATKQYVDAVAQGLHIHASAQTATTANIADLSSPPASIDGVTLTNNMRVLVKNQNTTSQNGVYVYSSSTGALTRASDFDTAIEIHGGDFIFVTGGTINNDTGWVQTETVTTVGTDPVIFQQFSGAGTYTAGTGLALNGNQFSNTGVLSVNGSTGAISGLAVTSGSLAQFSSTTSLQLKDLISDETGNGALVFATEPTLSQPVINNPRIGYTTTVTDQVTTTLTNVSAMNQFFTGIKTHTLRLPSTGTLALGQSYIVHNNSTNDITVETDFPETIYVVPSGFVVKFVCISTSTNNASSWDYDIVGSSTVTGTGNLVFSTSPTFTTSVVGGASFDVFNTTSTTINAFGAATTLNLGGTPTTTLTASIFANATASGQTKTINIGTAGVSGSTTNINIGSAVSGALGTITANEQTVFPAATTSSTSIRIPHGTAPTSPTNGDIWTTTSGLFTRVNGTTQQYAPLASPTFTGTVTAAAVSISGILDASEIRESVVDVTLSTNTATLDWTAGNVYYIATAPTGAMTFNVTNLPTDNSKIMTVGVIVTQGATGRIPSTFQIEGVAQTIKWIGGSAPTPTSSAGKIDIFTFTIQRTSASAWIVYGTSSLGF